MGRMSHLHTDTITRAPQSGMSGADPTYGAQVEIAGRWEEVDTVVISTDHNEYRSTSRFSTESEVLYSDRIWGPDDNTSDTDAARRILKIAHSRFPGETEGLYVVYM